MAGHGALDGEEHVGKGKTKTLKSDMGGIRLPLVSLLTRGIQLSLPATSVTSFPFVLQFLSFFCFVFFFR